MSTCSQICLALLIRKSIGAQSGVTVRLHTIKSMKWNNFWKSFRLLENPCLLLTVFENCIFYSLLKKWHQHTIVNIVDWGMQIYQWSLSLRYFNCVERCFKYANRNGKHYDVKISGVFISFNAEKNVKTDHQSWKWCRLLIRTYNNAIFKLLWPMLRQMP